MSEPSPISFKPAHAWRPSDSLPTSVSALAAITPNLTATVTPSNSEESITTAFSVEGMTCSNCARKVHQVVSALSGVVRAEVGLDAGTLQVFWAPASVPTPDAVVAALAKSGYPAKPNLDPDPVDAASRPKAPGSSWSQAVWVGVVCTAPLMVGEWILGIHHSTVFTALSAILGTVAAWVCGQRFLKGAWNQGRAGVFGMDALVTLGAGSAYLFSLAGLVSGFQGHLYFLEASAILTFISLGHWLEQRLGAQADGALRALLQLTPPLAHRLGSTGAEEEVPVGRLLAGDRIVLRAGDRIPADGRLDEGKSSVDESMLTGESKPVLKTPGSMLFAGTINLDGRLVQTITASGHRTALAHIIASVQRAQSSRAGIQRLADRVSQIFVPVVILLAVATFVAWGLYPQRMEFWHQSMAGWLWVMPAGGTAWVNAMIHATAVLIVACPCAMGLATPAALMAAANAAARRGILIRDAVALEKAGRITTVVFDKTGTLTVGHPALVATTWAADLSEADRTFLYGMVSALAASSRHPLSRQLATLSTQRPALMDQRETPGSGIQARLSQPLGRWAAGTELLLGSLEWQALCGADLRGVKGAMGTGVETGSSLAGFSVGGTVLGCFAFEDALKPEARGVLNALRGQGLKVHLVSGDHPQAARVLGAAAGLEANEISASVRPEGKAELIRGWQAQGQRVAFVGDGINDGPALAQADLGIAVSRASDVARESADLILINSDLRSVPEGLDLASRTLGVIRQNLFWALGYNLIAVPLAALGFLHPLVCAVAMGVSDVLVIGNSLRLLRVRTVRPAVDPLRSRSRRDHSP